MEIEYNVVTSGGNKKAYEGRLTFVCQKGLTVPKENIETSLVEQVERWLAYYKREQSTGLYRSDGKE